MSEENADEQRVRFYSVHDLASGWHAPRVVALATRFDPEKPLTNVIDVVELHNVQRYLEYRVLPNSLPEEERDRLVAKAPQIRSAIARFFNAIDGANFRGVVANVGREYHDDFLYLSGRNKVFERCDSSTVIPALEASGFHLSELLASKSLVQEYDSEMRIQLLAAVRSGELLIRKYLEKDPRGTIHLPRSFTSTDARDLLERYIDSADANLNYVRLIATANHHSQAGVDAKLKLRAKRRSDELNAKLFEENEGFKTGFEVGISDDQLAPSEVERDYSDGSLWRYTYSRHWLEETSDNPSILNNFQHLFDFTNSGVLLTLPSYPANLGVFEREMGMTGNADYKVGAAFRAMDTKSKLETHMYRRFLTSRDVDLEQVIAWFFEVYLVEEFQASNFSFTPSSGDASYLQRVRHLFAEMESVATQFSLFVENGELDRDLLAIGSNQVRYKEMPSMVDGKYVHQTGASEINGILHLLFSDQSRLSYIDENLHADNAATLLASNSVAYESFHEYQKADVDHLTRLGVLENTGSRVRLANLDQVLVFRSLFNSEAASYYHLSKAGREAVDVMVASSWVTRTSSLLTSAEGDYFNYFLNKVGFSNGPNLRNRYLHGVQGGTDTDDVHFDSYIIALRLLVALVIKINDDFCLSVEPK